MASLTLAPYPWLTFFTDTGVIAAGHKLFTYSAGSSTKLATYTDVGGLVAHSNPIVLDSAGRIPSGGLFLLPVSYKFVFSPPADTDPPTAPIRTQDNIGATPNTTIEQDIAITAGEALTANDLAYLSDGSGGFTAGRAYKADADNAYSSTAPILGVVVADIASGSTGTMRTGGRMTGFLGLTVGASYYASATAAEITVTAPTNSRLVGQADSVSSLIIASNPPPPNVTLSVDSRIKAICEGRLTLTTGVPVTVTDVTAAGTLYWAPFKGNRAGIYTGSVWQVFPLAQLSIVVPAVANQVYDVFLDYNAGTPVLSLTAWTNDTTRATAITTQDGVEVLTGTLTKRWVGTVRTGTASQLNDSLALRHVWNRWNQVDRPLLVLEATNTWDYTLTAFRQANNAAANRLDLVCGASENPIEIAVIAQSTNTNAGVDSVVAISEDSATVPATSCLRSVQRNAGAGDQIAHRAFLRTIPSVGRHYYAWLEYSAAAGTTTWTGDAGGALVQSGIHGIWTA